jgi:hypothetical protein
MDSLPKLSLKALENMGLQCDDAFCWRICQQDSVITLEVNWKTTGVKAGV